MWAGAPGRSVSSGGFPETQSQHSDTPEWKQECAQVKVKSRRAPAQTHPAPPQPYQQPLGKDELPDGEVSGHDTQTITGSMQTCQKKQQLEKTITEGGKYQAFENDHHTQVKCKQAVLHTQK